MNKIEKTNLEELIDGLVPCLNDLEELIDKAEIGEKLDKNNLKNLYKIQYRIEKVIKNYEK